jgi:hypothetical protein
MVGRGGEELEPISCWRGYEKRSTQSCRLARESIEGPNCITTESGEPAENSGFSVVAELEACNSKGGELVPTQ